MKKTELFDKIPTERPTKEELKAKLGALIDAADHFNSDLTQIIGSDNDGKVIFVALFALGEEAASIVRQMKRREKRVDKVDAKPPTGAPLDCQGISLTSPKGKASTR